MLTPLRVPLAGVLALLLGALAASVDASSGPVRCTALKFEATARAMAARYRFEIEAARGHVLPDLLTTAGLRMSAAVARADALGPCPGTQYALFQRINCVPGVNFPDARCNAALLTALRAKAVGLLHCHAGKARRNESPEPTCVTDKNRRFLQAITRIAAQCCSGCDLSHLESIVDFCVGEVTVALSCGNGVVDAGEQCDGQRFCTIPDCKIQYDPRCCVIALPSDPICVATPPALELCSDFGGTLVDGYCPDDPCPGDPFPGCQIGPCTDPPIPPTSVCCQESDRCRDATATTTLDLRALMRDCVVEGNRNVLGGCGPDGRQCVAE